MSVYKPMFKRLASLGVLALFAGPQPSLAQARPSVPAQTGPLRDTSQDNELLLAGDTVVVSASKQPQRISDSPAAVTVITAEDIRRSGLTSLPDLLRSVPGVEVSEMNASQQNVSVRGFNEVFAKQLLVMVDGRPIYDTAYGNVFWNTEPLLLSQIARIEVVRGPGSALYGANAFNGVINIITKTPLEQVAEDKVTFVGGVGERDSLFSEAMYAIGDARSWAATVGAGYHATSGFGGQGAGQVKDSDRVPILTADVQGRVPGGTLRLSGGDSDSRADVTSELVFPDAEWHTSYVNMAYNQERSSAPITARVSGNFFRLMASTVNFYSHTYDMEVQQQRALTPAHHLVYGLGYRATQLSSSLTGPQTHNELLLSGYAQDEWRLTPQTSVFAGLRWDHNSVYGAQVSPRLSVVHHLDHAQTLRISYGQAYQAPSLLDSYADEALPVAPGFSEELLGNTHVKPEKISTGELGWRRDLPHGYAALSVFENHISDFIGFQTSAFAPSPPFPPDIPVAFETQNSGVVDLGGFELEGELHPTAGLRLQANYSYQNVISYQGALADLPSHNLLNVTVQDDPSRRISLNIAGHYVDAMPYPGIATGGSAVTGASTTVPAYIRVDAKIGYHLSEKAELSLVGTNIFGDGHLEYPESTTLNGQPQTDTQRRTLWVMFSLGGW